MSVVPSHPPAASDSERGIVAHGWSEADRLLGTVLAAHFPAVVALGAWLGSPVLAALVGGVVSGSAWWLTRNRTGELSTRIAVGLSFMVYSALFIHLTGGMIEFHFHIFASLAFLAIYRDWRVPVSAAALIAVHHVAFHVLQMQGLPVYVFPREMAHGWGIVVIHALFVVYETAILVFIAERARSEALQSERLVDVARELGRGRILTDVRGEGGAVGSALDALGESMARLGTMLDQVRGQATQVAGASRRLSDTSNHLQGSSGRLGERARTLSDAVENQLDSAREMGEITVQFKAAVGQVASGAAAQAQDTEQMAAATDEMVRAIDEVAQLSKDVGARATQAAAVAREGHMVVNDAVDGMRQLKSSVEDAAAQVADLDGRSRKISEILEVLNTIAEQTNLLALNATIEAARAGEHGKGFAVVASEVRDLANRSARSANEIGEVLDAIRAGVGRVSKAMEAGTGIADESAERIQRAGQVLGEIMAATESSAADVDAIARSADSISTQGKSLGGRVQSVAVVTQENTQATESMSENSDRVAISVDTIMSTVKSGSESASEVTREVVEVSDSAVSVASAATELDRVAEGLIETVSAFETVRRAS